MVLFNEVLIERVSFQADASITYDSSQPNGIPAAIVNGTTGKASVTITGNKTVGLAADGQRVIGALYAVEQPVGGVTVAIVEVGGFAQFRANPAVAAGVAVVGAVNGAVKGYVRAAAPATLADVAQQYGVTVDITDNVNPWVWLP
jgi:hypothetical protein